MFLMTFFLLFFRVSQAAEIQEMSEPPIEFLHGFRFGYGYTNVDPAQHTVLRSKWLYLIGYELTQVLHGGDWIDVIFVENASIVGLNQSLFIPSGNMLIGFEFHDNFQLASGVNFVPTDEPFHMIVAAGWTPKVGDINIPCHISYIPDVNNNWRMYLTTGVNW